MMTRARAALLCLEALASLLASLSACKESHTTEDVTVPGRPFLYEAEFQQTPTLAALPDQVVIVDLEPTGAAEATAEDLSRHALEAGDYRFCIEKGDPYLEHLRLEDGEGRPAVDLDASAECVDAKLDRGTYRLRLRHRGGDISGAHRVAFVRRMNPSFSPLGDGGADPRGRSASTPTLTRPRASAPA